MPWFLRSDKYLDKSIMCSSASCSPVSFMARRSFKLSSFFDILAFVSGAGISLLVFWALYSSLSPGISLGDRDPRFPHASIEADPPDATFYDDPAVSYTIDRPIDDWDAKRREWLRLHPSLSGGVSERVLMVSGSQPGPCKNPVGDHLLLRFFKNKVDYCRRHGIEVFYNTALLHPAMRTFWAKLPVLRAAMLTHPEAEWIWWVDSDAIFTDMDFALPIHRYAAHSLVVHGWPQLVYGVRSWVSLNAGVFLIRNCQWSLNFMAEWASMGPMSPDYERWGLTQKAMFEDKVFDESDDQSALVYLLIKHKERLAGKVYLENDYYFEGYWLEIVGRLENISAGYAAMERRARRLRRRHAETVSVAYGRMREKEMRGEEGALRPQGSRRPFITHFTGCQPCSGNHNEMYTEKSCWEGMQRALHFADDQVLRDYGFGHRELLSADIEPLPFDFPSKE